MYHSHLALGILCIHLYLLCQSTCKTKKKKFELKKKNLKSSLRYFDSLKIKLAFDHHVKIGHQNSRSKTSITEGRHLPVQKALIQTLIYKLVIPNLICTLGQLECLCIDWALLFKM